MLKNLLRATIISAGLSLTVSPAYAQSCGYCPLDTYWGGVSDGAYHFDSDVPADVQQAAYYADDGWGAQYHDENNPSGTLITVAPLPSGTLGQYDANTNTLTVSEYLSDTCSSACNPMISTISHEFGHALGFDHFQSGCESSIMSWVRDRQTVIYPSNEDLCWYSSLGGGGWDCDNPKHCIPEDRDKRGGHGDDIQSTHFDEDGSKLEGAL